MDLFFSQSAGHGLARYCPSPVQIRPMQYRWVALAAAIRFTAPHETTYQRARQRVLDIGDSGLGGLVGWVC